MANLNAVSILPSPEIRHGDFIACKEVTDRRFIVYGVLIFAMLNVGVIYSIFVIKSNVEKQTIIMITQLRMQLTPALCRKVLTF